MRKRMIKTKIGLTIKIQVKEKRFCLNIWDEKLLLFTDIVEQVPSSYFSL